MKTLDLSVKNCEKKFEIKCIIQKNLGLARVIIWDKKAKTKFVFLNNPDMIIDDKSIKGLIHCVKNTKDGAISPAFKKENIYKNYKFFDKKKIKNQNFQKI